MSPVEPADLAARRRVLVVALTLAAVLGVGYLLLDRWLDEVSTRPVTEARRALALALRAVIAALVVGVAAFGSYAYRLGAAVRRHQRFPPPGVAVIRATPVLEGAQAIRRGALLQVVAVVLGALALALGLGTLRLAAQLDVPATDLADGLSTREPDAFYRPPDDLPPGPGVLLRHEPLGDVQLPAGLAGRRILYTTTIDDATPATAVATVFVPTAAASGPRPVLAWAHGTTGLLQRCMPSLVSAPTEGIPARAAIVSAGWVVVATDYSFAEPDGPHPYLIGEGQARAVLDAVRAARQLPDVDLDARTVVWGHSQGGHAALWAGTVAPRYAPDVPLAGVVAIAPAADPLVIQRMNVAVDQRLGPYTAAAYARFYPDVTVAEALRPAARAAGVEMAGLCAFLPKEDPARIVALAASFRGPALATDTNPALVARLAENRASVASRVPVLVAQGLGDFVVPAIATEQWVAAECAAGRAPEYWVFAGVDHAGIVRPGSPLESPLIAWTAGRLAGRPTPGDCRRRAF